MCDMIYDIYLPFTRDEVYFWMHLLSVFNNFGWYACSIVLLALWPYTSICTCIYFTFFCFQLDFR